jgi:serine/threonine-protein kinase HipA
MPAKFDPSKLNALTVHLGGRRIGVITRLAGDRQLFAFEQDYLDDPHRPTLSLSFKGRSGGIVTSVRPVTRRVPPFFSNLLPEGPLRTYLAEPAGVKAEREFFLLATLGEDLPGRSPSHRSEPPSPVVTTSPALKTSTVRTASCIFPSPEFSSSSPP